MKKSLFWKVGRLYDTSQAPQNPPLILKKQNKKTSILNEWWGGGGGGGGGGQHTCMQEWTKHKVEVYKSLFREEIITETLDLHSLLCFPSCSIQSFNLKGKQFH